MVHRDFGQEAMESPPILGGLTASPLVFVDDQDALLGPTQRHGLVGQGVLPFPRFLVIKHLPRRGLSDIDDS